MAVLVVKFTELVIDYLNSSRLENKVFSTIYVSPIYFRGYKKVIRHCTEINTSEHIKLSASKAIFCKVLKRHLFKLAYL